MLSRPNIHEIVSCTFSKNEVGLSDPPTNNQVNMVKNIVLGCDHDFSNCDIEQCTMNKIYQELVAKGRIQATSFPKSQYPE